MSLVNYGFTSNKQDAAVQQETEEKLQIIEQFTANKTKKQQLSKKRKWNDAFTELGFVKDSDENYPSARCVFCQVIYHNSSMEKYKLKRHRDTKHSEHKNKSATFFKQQTRQYALQQQRFEQLMVAPSDQPLVITSLKIAHVLMSQKKPFTLAESVVKPCLEIVAQEIHGGATAVTKVQKLALSDNTMQRRCSMIAASLKEIVLAKLRLAPCFGLQLDETTDITSKAQLIAYVRFPSIERMKIVDHYLFCFPIGIETTALSVFSKLDNYFSEHEVMWSKCKSVSTDGARAMVGVRNGVVALIKQVAPEVVSIHCILHREALVAKKIANEEKNCQLADVICDVTKIVTTILKKPKSNRAFHELVREMGDDVRLVYHSEVRWLSRGRVLERVWNLRETLVVWFNGREEHRANMIQNLFWLARLAYLVDIFGMLNVLNITLQGCGIDIFEATSKITSFKQKLESLEKEICSNNLQNLKTLQSFMSACKWEETEQDLEQRIVEVASSHVNILRDSFEAYFPSHQAAELKSKLWILNPFGEQQPPGPLGQILKNDFCQQAFFNRGKHAEFWVGALDGAYKDLAIQALKVLVQNPTTYLAEKGFSALVDIKTSKRSCVLNETLDDLMRGALE